MKSEKDRIYSDVGIVLHKMLVWFSSGDDRLSFDFDVTFNEILEKYNIDIHYGVLNHIYFLVDVLYDSMSHQNPMITDTYSTENGLQDLKYIVKMIDSNKVQELEDNFDLRARLLKLYN